MWLKIILLQLLPQFTLSAQCPSACVCDIKGSVRCIGDITDIPPLEPSTTFLLLLNDTNIKVLKNQTFQPLFLLLRVMITHSALDTIHHRAFHGAPQLRSIKMSSNRLSDLPPNMFSEQGNLEQLQLDDNHITFIGLELFEGLLNLTELDLSKNHIGHLDSDVFQNLTKLIYLNLAGNQLRNLPKTVFHNLRKLKSLVLSSNQLETLESGSFDHLSNLLLLMLQKNQIREIAPRLFWHLPSLLTLSMSNNHLRSIPAQSFYYLPNLTKLTLYKNPLMTLPDQLMGHMPRLQELYLYETSLVTVPWNLFANMTNLRSLNVHFNDKLSILPKDLFCCLPNLKKLSLKYNNLQELDPEIFSNLISLQILMLNENKLESLPATIFHNTSRLEILDLNHNHLRNLPGDVFVQARALNALSLSGNKWTCDCQIMAIAEWIRENPRRINDLDKGVECHEPKRLQNRPLHTLTYEELQCGQGDLQTTLMAATQAPATSTQEISSPVATSTKVDASTRTFATNPALLSPTTDHGYFQHGNNINSEFVFYETIVLDNGPEIVHNNRYNGWVYLWTVPSTGTYSGFMMALYTFLLLTGVILIVVSWFALYRLYKVMSVLATVTVRDNQRLTGGRARFFKIKL